MRILGIAVLGTVVSLLFPASASAGYCDLIVNWDGHTLDSCISEMKTEIEMLRLQLQTEQSQNRLMRVNMCILAMELKTENSASVAEIACAELKAKAAAKKKAPAGRANP